MVRTQQYTKTLAIWYTVLVTSDLWPLIRTKIADFTREHISLTTTITTTTRVLIKPSLMSWQTVRQSRDISTVFVFFPGKVVPFWLKVLCRSFGDYEQARTSRRVVCLCVYVCSRGGGRGWVGGGGVSFYGDRDCATLSVSVSSNFKMPLSSVSMRLQKTTQPKAYRNKESNWRVTDVFRLTKQRSDWRVADVIIPAREYYQQQQQRKLR